jgi:hypothetical protein
MRGRLKLYLPQSRLRNSSPTCTAVCAAPERQFGAPASQYAFMGALIWLAG